MFTIIILVEPTRKIVIKAFTIADVKAIIEISEQEGYTIISIQTT